LASARAASSAFLQPRTQTNDNTLTPQHQHNKPNTHKNTRFKKKQKRYWLSVGAEPSDRVAYVLSRAGLLPRAPAPPTKPVCAAAIEAAKQKKKK
jgi:ribosomal protein S16